MNWQNDKDDFMLWLKTKEQNNSKIKLELPSGFILLYGFFLGFISLSAVIIAVKLLS